MTAENVHHLTARKTRPCPICNKPSSNAFHPFCTRRCANVDLGKWLGGNYAIATEEPTDDFGGQARENGTRQPNDDTPW